MNINENPGLVERNMKMLSIAATCRLLGISRSKLYYLTASASKYYAPSFPKPIQIGRNKRFRMVEIDAWLSSQRTCELEAA